MSRIDLYTPWREDPSALRRRTVSRTPLVESLYRGASELAAGRRPLPVYLFGPRGVGKSHILALLRDRAQQLGLNIRSVSEDIPSISTPDDLLSRAESTGAVPAWRRSTSATALVEDGRPTILFIEGLDRRLSELGRGDSGHRHRQVLRSRWDLRPGLWVVGTGVELGTEITDSAEPFFGWFNPEAVPLLTEAEGRDLLDRLTPEDVRSRPFWPARRDALATLAGGSARVLVTLAESCASPEAPEQASEALLSAVDHFTAHYQLRFRDLSGMGQQIVDLLATSAREMGPSEMAVALSLSPTSVGTQARRMVNDGVLSRREIGANSSYGIAEPLFRYWLEYRNAPWESTRVAVAASLLQALYSPRELVERWWEEAIDPHTPLTHATTRVELAQRVTEKLRSELRVAAAAADHGAALHVLSKAKQARKVGVLEQDAGLMTLLSRNPECASSVAALFSPASAATLLFATDLRASKDTPRSLFRAWLQAVRPGLRGPTTIPWQSLTQVFLQALEDTSTQGRPLSLELSEQRTVGDVPYLRAALLLRGRLPGHSAVLDPAALTEALIGPTTPDLPQLLTSSILRSAPELTERVLLAVRLESPPAVPRCPHPGVVISRRPDRLVEWLIRRTQWPIPQSLDVTLTWSASFAVVEEEAFERLLAALRGSKSSAPRRLQTDAQNAMLALGIAAPKRQHRLAEALPDTWRPLALEALTLAEQLVEGEGRLYPELERLYTALVAELA